jgi:hypothetical protein
MAVEGDGWWAEALGQSVEGRCGVAGWSSYSPLAAAIRVRKQQILQLRSG